MFNALFEVLVAANTKITEFGDVTRLVYRMGTNTSLESTASFFSARQGSGDIRIVYNMQQPL
jgi:hypothetical protein